MKAKTRMFGEIDIQDKVRGFDQIYKHSDDGLAEACVEFLSRKHDKSSQKCHLH